MIDLENAVAGYKSFRLAPTTLTFAEGRFSALIGPNGCGKSNLVEALRWVMGETSAKQMRGGEMDDVIFGGTRDRPPRNIAEVILSLDNVARVAPAQFNDTDELEISRRIEREKGSTYRVNGHEVRAKDVQLLFADSATGARSTALVSQGKISAVIAAKPTERRLILEEAAGITGLHSRRHDHALPRLEHRRRARWSRPPRVRQRTTQRRLDRLGVHTGELHPRLRRGHARLCPRPRSRTRSRSLGVQQLGQGTSRRAASGPRRGWR